MRLKTTRDSRRIVLLVLFLICIPLVVYIVPRIFQQLSVRPSRIITNKEIQSVVSISLSTKNKSVELIRKKEEWMVKEGIYTYPADIEKIKKMLSEIEQIEKKDIVAQTEKKYAELGVVENKIVLDFSNRKSLTIFVGKPASWGRSYARFDTNPETYLVNGLTEIFSPFEYRSFQIGIIKDLNQVSAISIASTLHSFFLKKINNGWIFETGEKPKEERVQFLLQDLKTLTATDIMNEIPQELPFPFITLSVIENRKELIAYIYDLGNEQYLFVIQGKKSGFILTSVQIDTLTKDLSYYIQ